METIEILSNEGINVYNIQRGDKTLPRQGFIYTLKGTEILLDENFFFDFTVNETFNIQKNSRGYAIHSYDYSIIEKITGNEVFSQ